MDQDIQTVYNKIYGSLKGDRHGSSLQSINARTSEVLAKIKQNRDKHNVDHEKDMVEYNLALEEYGKVIKNMVDKQAYSDISKLPCPQKPVSHVTEYNQVIAMLEFSKDAEIILTARDVDRYINDNWEWREGYEFSKSLNTRYLTRSLSS